MSSSHVTALASALLMTVAACARSTGDMVGRPLTTGQRQDAYQAVLEALPDTLRVMNPVLRPAVCLDRGIYASSMGAHVEDHDQAWLDSMTRRQLVTAIADHSPAGCPDRSYWVVLANTVLLSADSVAVPLTIQRVWRGTGPQADRLKWRAIVTRSGGWDLVGWEAS